MTEIFGDRKMKDNVNLFLEKAEKCELREGTRYIIASCKCMVYAWCARIAGVLMGIVSLVSPHPTRRQRGQTVNRCHFHSPLKSILRTISFLKANKEASSNKGSPAQCNANWF